MCPCSPSPSVSTTSSWMLQRPSGGNPNSQGSHCKSLRTWPRSVETGGQLLSLRQKPQFTEGNPARRQALAFLTCPAAMGLPNVFRSATAAPSAPLADDDERRLAHVRQGHAPLRGAQLSDNGSEPGRNA